MMFLRLKFEDLCVDGQVMDQILFVQLLYFVNYFYNRVFELMVKVYRDERCSVEIVVIIEW